MHWALGLSEAPHTGDAQRIYTDPHPATFAPCRVGVGAFLFTMLPESILNRVRIHHIVPSFLSAPLGAKWLFQIRQGIHMFKTPPIRTTLSATLALATTMIAQAKPDSGPTMSARDWAKTASVA